MRRRLLPLCLALTLCINVKAQSNLTVDQSYTVEEMVMDFFNHPSISISNVSYSGSGAAYGFFDSGEPSETILGVGAGILISTGEATGAIGPNDSESLSGQLNSGTDADLSNLGGSSANDAAVIIFDLTTSSELLLDFKYAFGSEEYCEYVGSGFNDVFGFFVSGPGMNGPFSNNSVNIATLTGTADYVGINSINHITNTDYFLSNSTNCNMGVLDAENLQYDGLSVPLSASFTALAGETYTIKLALGDVSDNIFDSGVFIGFNSLSLANELIPPTEFAITTDPISTEVNFTNHSKYATSYLWDFGNGMTSTEQNPPMVNYATPGDYEVSLTTSNYCCTNTYTETITVGNDVSSVYTPNNTFTFDLFPNPVKDQVQLTWSEQAAIQSVEVLDLLGKSIVINTHLTGNQLSLNFENVPPAGIYYVQILLEDGRVGIKRFVVE